MCFTLCVDSQIYTPLTQVIMVGKVVGGEYLGYLTLRVGGGRYVTAAFRCGPRGVVVKLGVVGGGVTVPKFGPWPRWVEVLRAVLSPRCVVEVCGATYPFRYLLASLGYLFDKRKRAYVRYSLTAPEGEEGEALDFYEEVGI